MTGLVAQMRSDDRAAVVSFRTTARSWFANMGPSGWLGAAISLAVLVAVADTLVRLNTRAVLAAIPRQQSFWALFALWFMAAPAADWVIFRRLWRLPAAGFAALVRKNVANNLLLGYMGEVYFYAWARRRLTLAAAPFGAVKDVAVLSALAGNAVTIASLAVVWPLLAQFGPAVSGRSLVLPLLVVVGSTAVIVALRRRIFSLALPERRFALTVQLARVALSTCLAALVWSTALPGRPFELWLALATVSLVIGRLPFMPNRDLVVAGVTTLLFGAASQVSTAVTAVAGLSVLAHVAVGTALAGPDLLGWRKP